MRNKKYLILPSIILITILTLFLNNLRLNAQEPTLIIEEFRLALQSQSINVKEIQLEQQQLKIVVISQGINTATPEDLTAQRIIRDLARDSKYAHVIRDLEIRIDDRNGRVIDQLGIADIAKRPEHAELLHSSLTFDQVQQRVQLLGQQYRLNQLDITIAEREQGNKRVNFTASLLDHDINQVNHIINNLQTEFDQLNLQGAAIQQVELLINDVTGQPLVKLSADLVYREWTWWQSPKLEESWTGEGPQAPAP